jgi:ComF family protein
MGRLLRILADAVWPRQCEACDRALAPGERGCLCPSCVASITPPTPPLCERCGAPVGRAAGLCPSCRRSPPAFAAACALGLYLPAADGHNPLATAVQRLKYAGRRVVAATLGELLAERYPFGPGALLVPVPLHRTRLRMRGYNQALLLARFLARERGLPLAPRALARRRPTAAQAGLDAVGRRANLRDAFAVASPAIVAGRAVVLVDDVLTTGATADACARALLGAGATGVSVYTVGRAP